MKRAVIIRFARGLGYTLAGSAIAYGMANVDAVASVAPRYAFLVPFISGALLAADKWVRARQGGEDQV